MSDTPRTDAVVIAGEHEERGVEEYVSASFARDLEREGENAARLLALVLPMAKAFAAKSDVGSNVNYVLAAEEFMRAQAPVTVRIRVPESYRGRVIDGEKAE